MREGVQARSGFQREAGAVSSAELAPHPQQSTARASTSGCCLFAGNSAPCSSVRRHQTCRRCKTSRAAPRRPGTSRTTASFIVRAAAAGRRSATCPTRTSPGDGQQLGCSRVMRHGGLRPTSPSCRGRAGTRFSATMMAASGTSRAPGGYPHLHCYLERSGHEGHRKRSGIVPQQCEQ